MSIEINKHLNRALRSLSELGAAFASSSASDRSSAIQEISLAIEIVTNLRTKLHDSHPELVYHYDSQRQPTDFMRAVFGLIKSAEDSLAKGHLDLAIRDFESAKDLEPPALTYEMICRQIESIKQLARPEISGHF